MYSKHYKYYRIVRFIELRMQCDKRNTSEDYHWNEIKIKAESS